MNLPKNASKFLVDRDTRTTVDPDGTEHKTEAEKSRAIEKSTEPDYIKLYTRMWCEFNGIPERYRLLFLELASRMSYCNKSDLDSSQIVYTGEPVASSICSALGWKQKDSLMKGLKALCDCNAIKKVNRAVYQINPSYAGRGEWKYNSKYDRGGVENLVATFDFAKGTVQTKIIWTDDGQDTELNAMYRQMLGVKPGEQAMLTETVTKPQPKEAKAPETAADEPTASGTTKKKQPRRRKAS